MSDATLPAPEPGERIQEQTAEAVLAQAETAVEQAAEAIDMTPLDVPRRLLLVHAHPDDETIGTGATMAHYAAQGVAVTLVTCTMGEEGEVLVPELAHLAADLEDGLGQHRVGELAAAMEALRVTDSRFLGGPGRWRDSGMIGTPANERPTASGAAELDEAVRSWSPWSRDPPQVGGHLRQQRRLRPPDHIQAHRVTVAPYDARPTRRTPRAR
jgi:N-acetyl-1-D-myo-inositol-2-amino-2-deoxy-alpha-D-glucopyranoside deacetylase